jgi:ribosome biogenesis GTPase
VTAEPHSGCIVECYGRRAVVRLDDGSRAACKLGRRRIELVAGDEVRIGQSAGDDEWTVLERLPRRNLFSRSDARGRTEPIAANLDQLAVVVAPLPACDPFIVDRYVCGARQAGIETLVVLNKQDLSQVDDLAVLSPLEGAGVRLLRVSARTGLGLQALIEQLSGRRSLFAGQSGVGKSSLMNTLAGADLRVTGALSTGSGEGKHTTVSSAIHSTPWGELVDSPGVRDYAPPSVAPREVQHGFAEIEALAPGCRFLDCLHLREPRCAVRAAAETGTLDARRYESYRRLLNLNRQLVERRGHAG